MSDQESKTEPAEQRMSQEVIQTETGLHEEDDDAEDQRRQNDRNQQGGETNQITSSSDVGNSTATGEIKLCILPQYYTLRKILWYYYGEHVRCGQSILVIGYCGFSLTYCSIKCMSM